MMTATASSTTMRILQNQFPEILKWENLITSPLRKNVTLLVPPSEIISSSLEVTLAPFISDMKDNDRTYLVIVRGTENELNSTVVRPSSRYQEGN